MDEGHKNRSHSKQVISQRITKMEIKSIFMYLDPNYRIVMKNRSRVLGKCDVYCHLDINYLYGDGKFWSGHSVLTFDVKKQSQWLVLYCIACVC